MGYNSSNDKRSRIFRDEEIGTTETGGGEMKKQINLSGRAECFYASTGIVHNSVTAVGISYVRGTRVYDDIRARARERKRDIEQRRWRVMAEIPVRERNRVQACPFVLQPIINNTGHVIQICLIRCITSFLRLSNVLYILRRACVYFCII